MDHWNDLTEAEIRTRCSCPPPPEFKAGSSQTHVSPPPNTSPKATKAAGGSCWPFLDPERHCYTGSTGQHLSESLRHCPEPLTHSHDTVHIWPHKSCWLWPIFFHRQCPHTAHWPTNHHQRWPTSDLNYLDEYENTLKLTSLQPSLLV